MSDFKAKMHQNPKFGWGSLQRSPDTLAGFKGPTSKGRGGSGGDVRGREGRVWEGIGGDGRGGVLWSSKILKIDPVRSCDGSARWWTERDRQRSASDQVSDQATWVVWSRRSAVAADSLDRSRR